jgi:hypothetical protein
MIRANRNTSQVAQALSLKRTSRRPVATATRYGELESLTCGRTHSLGLQKKNCPKIRARNAGRCVLWVLRSKAAGRNKRISPAHGHGLAQNRLCGRAPMKIHRDFCLLSN